MKFIRLTVLLAALLALHGCAFKDEADVDVKEAILHSPEGDFEFKRDKKIDFHFMQKIQNTPSLFHYSLVTETPL